MNNKTTLYEFGYNFLGPICSEYFYTLRENIEAKKPSQLIFLAREGYLFEKIYKRLVALKAMPELESTYLYVSRTFLFRIGIADPHTWQWSLSHKYSGSLNRLLAGRFGLSLLQTQNIFSPDELEQEYCLPDDQEALANVLLSRLSDLKALTHNSKMAYLDYLSSVNLTQESIPLFVDVGYSGTIQKLLTHMLKINTRGVYFITTQAGEHKLGNNTAVMNFAFKDRVKMGDGYDMLDRSLFLECLLTAPTGQFMDLARNPEHEKEDFDFFFGRQAYTQENFHELGKVMDGALDCAAHNFTHDVRFTLEEIENLFSLYTRSRKMFPSAIWPLFDVDDAISGNAHVDPFRLFGL